MAKKSPFAGKTKTKPLGNSKMTKSQLNKAGYGKPSPSTFAPKKSMKSGGCMGCGGKMKK